MKYALVFLLLALSACAKPHRNTGEFEPYVAAFEAEAAAHGRTLHVDDITIEYGDAGAGHPALCKGSQDRIIVNEDYWKHSAVGGERQVLLFHELGHCVLGRSHKPGLMPDGAPASIMAPTPPSYSQWDKWKEDYLAELFREE